MASGEENDDTQDADALEDYPEISIATVHAIRVGKVAWYPTTQVVQGQTFFNVSKHDSVLTKLTTGRRANRHKGKSNNVISQKRIWHDLYVARREACNEAFAQAQRQAMESAGEVVAADHKFRAAHDGDQFFVKGGAVELQLGNSRVLTTFAVKGPLFFRLDLETVKQVLEAIRNSPDAEIASPKRKRRRRKKGASMTPQRKRRSSEGLEEPNVSEADDDLGG